MTDPNQSVTGSLVLHRVWLRLADHDSEAAKLVDGLRNDLARDIAAFYRFRPGRGALHPDVDRSVGGPLQAVRRGRMTGDQAIENTRGALILHRVWLRLVRHDVVAAKTVDRVRLELVRELAEFYGLGLYGRSGLGGVSCALRWAALLADPRKLYGEDA
jgi:hypothetical protein